MKIHKTNMKNYLYNILSIQKLLQFILNTLIMLSFFQSKFMYILVVMIMIKYGLITNTRGVKLGMTYSYSTPTELFI